MEMKFLFKQILIIHIEFIIPRDPNLIIPSMILQNVTSINSSHNLLFNLHYINITQSNNLSISVHFEMQSFEFKSCLFINL